MAHQIFQGDMETYSLFLFFFVTQYRHHLFCSSEGMKGPSAPGSPRGRAYAPLAAAMSLRTAGRQRQPGPPHIARAPRPYDAVEEQRP